MPLREKVSRHSPWPWRAGYLDALVTNTQAERWFGVPASNIAAPAAIARSMQRLGVGAQLDCCVLSWWSPVSLQAMAPSLPCASPPQPVAPKPAAVDPALVDLSPSDFFLSQPPDVDSIDRDAGNGVADEQTKPRRNKRRIYEVTEGGTRWFELFQTKCI